MLTDRQKQILIAIISEFMSSADEVGSTTLVDKYNIPASSATIRSEMVRLMDQGFLEKSHISSGRYPTDQAIRLYVKELLNHPTLSAVEEALVRNEIFKVRFSKEELVKEILDILVKRSNSAAFILLDDMTRYFGVSSLMRYEELRNVKVMERVLDLLEDSDLLKQVFSRYAGDEVSLLIGRECGIPDLEDCSIAFTKITTHNNNSGHMGIIGSRRLEYSKVVPLLNTVRNTVESSLKGWR